MEMSGASDEALIIHTLLNADKAMEEFRCHFAGWIALSPISRLLASASP